MATSDYRPGTFDSRIIEYEKVHHITDEQIAALERAVGLKKGQKVLDGCCGYGSVTKWLLRDSAVASTCEFHLQDESPVQIERAKENLKAYPGLIFTVEDIKKLPYPNGSFDVVVIKMGLHENPKESQQLIVNEMFRVLKPGGKIVVWELYLNDKTQPIFQAYIRKKDELAGFDVLAQQRYFPRGDEIRNELSQAGFTTFTEHLVFSPLLGTKVRFDELISRELKEKGAQKPDEALLDLATERLGQLNDYLRTKLTQEQKDSIGFKDEGDNIAINNIDKAIVSATKPI